MKIISLGASMWRWESEDRLRCTAMPPAGASRSARWTRAAIAAALLTIPVVVWNGTRAYELTLRDALAAIDEGDGDQLRPATATAYLHATRVVDRLQLLARRQDQTGTDARVLLDRLHELTR